MPSVAHKMEMLMGMETWIAIGVIALIVGLAAGYVIKAKKSGKKCIGCPEGGCKECSCSCSQKSE